jgi:hypothetical protein
MKGLSFLFPLSLLLIVPARAQVTTAQLAGQVKDPAGAVIVGASVKVRNVMTGLIRETTTSESGTYLLPNLPPGTYELEVMAPGFRPYRQQQLELTIGQNATLDVRLEIGEVTEVVTVTGQAILLDTSKTEISQVVSERQISDLPISGRNFVDFVLLGAKVAVGRANLGGGPQQEPPVGVGVTAAARLSFGGQTEYSTFVAVDGVDTTQTFNGLQRSAPSQEVAKEFRIVNTSYSSEFGRGFGLVNIITRSGGNDLHGSAYVYLRNEALDARNILQPPDLDRHRQVQYGAVVSGPIRKDRTFFIGNYEGQQRDQNPLFAEVILRNLAALNRAKRALGFREEDIGILQTNDYNVLFGKVDHYLTPAHTLSVRYNLVKGESLNVLPISRASMAPSTARDNDLSDQSLAVGVMSLGGSRLVNEVRFQYARRNFTFDPVAFTEPALEIPNLILMGHSYSDFEFYRESRIQFLDNFTLVRGRHALKLGFDYNRLWTTEQWTIFYPMRVIFPSLTAFLSDPPTVAALQWLPPRSRPDISVDPRTRAVPEEWRRAGRASIAHHLLGFFAQDEWRPRPNFSFIYGFRWDAHLVPTDLVGRDLNNIQPRVGFSYSLGGRRKTILRGGAGLFHDKFLLGDLLATRLVSNQFWGTVFPSLANRPGQVVWFAISGPPVATPAFFTWLRTGVYPSPSDPAIRLIGATNFDRSNAQPYSFQTSLEIEQEITPRLVLTANYLRVRGLKLTAFRGNYNAFPTGRAPNGKPFYGGRRFSEYLLAAFYQYCAWSTYDGGTWGARFRPSEALDVMAHYTFSKTIDMPTNIALQNIPEDPLNWNLDRALSNQHVAHRFVLNFLTTAPSSWGIVRGFKLSGIVRLESPRYFTVSTGADTNGDGNPLTDRPGLLGRNTYKGDSYYSVDLRLSRMLRVSERVTVEPLVEFFNLFNTVNVIEINTVWGAPTLDAPPNPLFGFGTPRAVANARQIQLALKLQF